MKFYQNSIRLFSLAFLLFFAIISFAFKPVSNAAYDYVVTVLDDKGQPLFGVSVFTNDQEKVATTTDENGKATLKDLDNKDEVNFTFVGFTPLRLPFYEIRRRNGIIRMSRAATELNEVVVIGRRDDLPSQVPYTFTKVTKENISFYEPQTTADALWNTAGVFVQKTQMGGGSPVLRGFEANRVLLVVDGVRMNSAIYRSGHLQNSITVDNAMLERTEVIFGPGSLLYGSDALGGVIHFRSKEPKLALGDQPSTVESNLYTRYASANEEKSIHADVNYGKKNWASLTSLTFTDYNDLRAGGNRPDGYEDFGKRLYFVRRNGNNDEVVENVVKDGSGYKPNYNVQIGTAYSQIDFMEKIKYQPNRNFFAVLNFQQSTSTDVPRYDYLTELKNPADPTSLRYAEWFYGPQRRLMTSLKLRFSKPTSIYDRATIIAAYQQLHENRLQRLLHKSQRIYQLEDVNIYSITADFDKKLNESGRQVLMYGVDLNYNDINSEGGRVKITDESITKNALSRYPADNSVKTVGAYANYHVTNADTTLALDAGLRFTGTKLLSIYSQSDTVNTVWPTKYYEPGVGATNSDLTWSLGGTWMSKTGTKVRLLGSKAFRSPNIDDYSQFRPRNGYINIPNTDLGPERSYNIELHLGQKLGAEGDPFQMNIGLTGFYTYVKDIMTRRAFSLPDGTNIVTVDGVDFETRANVNANKGIIKGLSGELQARIGEKWGLESTLTLTRGDVSFDVKDAQGTHLYDKLEPLDHIPPANGFTSLTYEIGKFKASAVLRYQFAKKVKRYGVSDVSVDSNGNLVLGRGGTEDNLEYAYYHIDSQTGNVVYDGTLAWTTYNLYTSYSISKMFTVHAAVENITDLHYRPFSSGVSAAGRNFIVSLRVNLSK
ncbi:MAG: TonB-dependent receptor plug domain-containing protein [Bacteroidetes bacterium]|nr:TonB-dependent receptor plug domain-containing protein [Bacteroidota bacterium]